MFELIKRHFQSAGFKRRLMNVYIPAAKIVFGYVWNRVRDLQQQKKVNEQFTGDVTAFQGDAEKYEEAAATGNATPLQYEDAVEVVKKYVFDFSPQFLGKCVAHTIVNSYRFVTKATFGVDVHLSEDDVYIDRATLPGEVDGGMYPDRAIVRVAEKGIAPYGFVKEAQTNDDLRANTRTAYPDAKLQPFRLKHIASHKTYNAVRDFEPLWNFIVNEYATRGVRPFQFTIFSNSGWWNGDLPTPTNTDNVNGSHSVLGLTIPFLFNGERAFFAFDSSYATWRVWRIAKGVRIVRESAWKVCGNSFRALTFTPEIEAVLANKVQEPTHIVLGFDPASLSPVQQGDNKAAVKVLQLALRYVLGKNDIFNATTYYGSITAAWVREFHQTYSDRFVAHGWSWDGTGGTQSLSSLGGRYAGNVTIAVLREVVDTMHT